MLQKSDTGPHVSDCWRLLPMLWQQEGQLKLSIYSHDVLGVYTALQFAIT